MTSRSQFESVHAALFVIFLSFILPETTAISTTICQNSSATSRLPAAARTCDRLFEELGPRLEFKLPGALEQGFKRPRRLRIGHYNLGNYRTVAIPGGRQANLKSPIAVAQIVETIKRERPDVLMLSEIENRASLDDLAKRLDGEYRAEMIEGNDQWPFDVAVIIRKSLPFEVTIQSHRALTHRYLGQTVPVFSRDLILVELRLPKEKRPVIAIAGSHFKSMSTPFRTYNGRTDEKSVKKRFAQIETSIDVFSKNEAENSPKGFVFIADFNADVQSGIEFTSLHSAGFKDAFQALGIRPENRVTHSSFKPKQRPEHLQLDGIFVSSHIVNREALLSAYVVPDRDALGNPLERPRDNLERERRPSDHNMVIMEVDLSKLR